MGALLVFTAAIVVAWSVFFGRAPDAGAAGARSASPARTHGGWSVAWRAALALRTEFSPCAWSNGWVVADSAGLVVGVSREGAVRWRSNYSNEVFSGACPVGAQVAVASEGGSVYLFDAATGAVLWRRGTDGRFVRAPIFGANGQGAVLWLVSQDDGRLFCLRAADGALLWTGEATNRCDGSPTFLPAGAAVAYGNCDGAIYVFEAATGKLRGRVEIGPEDQMAGGLLALPDGRVAAGTRSGKLVVVDLARQACDATVNVSESEAFVTPVPCFRPSVFAVGVSEGDVSIWDVSDRTAPKRTASFAAGQAVDALASDRGFVFALASGALTVFDGRSVVARVSLGDAVGALGVNAGGELACVADGALLCVREGGS